MRRFAPCAIAALAVAPAARAAPLAASDIAALCTNAEDQAHCGRLVEARQFKRLRALGRIVERDGDELRVALAPSGTTVFRDRIDIIGAKSYAVWDYLDHLDTLILFTTDGDRTSFLLVQRRGGEEYRVPSEPVLAPDERHFVTADFCERDCDNEVTIWRIEAQALYKEATWAPAAAWTDVSVTWRGNEAIALEYALPSEGRSRTIERRLNDSSWKRAPAR